MAKRWDGDERGEGVADAAAFAIGAGELVEIMRRPRWVAENPEIHLFPHIERACATLPLRVERSGVARDGVFELELVWTGEGRSVGQSREAVFALVGSFSESATYVRQRRCGSEADRLVFEVVTGFLDDAAFAAHGHTVRIMLLL